MAFKRRNMFHKNKKQETTEIEKLYFPCSIVSFSVWFVVHVTTFQPKSLRTNELRARDDETTLERLRRTELYCEYAQSLKPETGNMFYENKKQETTEIVLPDVMFPLETCLSSDGPDLPRTSWTEDLVVGVPVWCGHKANLVDTEVDCRLGSAIEETLAPCLASGVTPVLPKQVRECHLVASSITSFMPLILFNDHIYYRLEIMYCKNNLTLV
ncbi:hypothetical protein AAG570_003150 [Ranatra chinensis]|uniref:Uncharacterized protein n=1 Tax=Ranatra chinensis TaxID=642074 RepID=A0ABD0Y838_9HEMI